MLFTWERVVLLACVMVASTAYAQPAGLLVITSTPDGAEVIVDGKSIGKAPTQAQLLPGEHLVQVKWSSGKEASQVVTIEAGASKLVKLVESAAPAPANPSPAPTNPSPAPTNPSPDPTPVSPPDSTATAPPPPADPPTADNVLDRPVDNPLHPQLRGGTAFDPSVGLLCLLSSNIGLSTGCVPELRVAASWGHGEIHLKVEGGSSITIGGKIGFGVGTRYHSIEGAPRVTWAFRVDVDAFIIAPDTVNGMPFVFGQDLATFGIVPTPGINFSIGVAHDLAIEVRGSLAPYFGVGPSDSLTTAGFAHGWMLGLTAGARL